MVDCAACGRHFERCGADRPAALIAVEVSGDECTESFFFCASCGVYTQETHWEPFFGEESSQVSGPIDKARGDAIVASIRRCPDPTNKKCSCPTHREFL